MFSNIYSYIKVHIYSSFIYQITEEIVSILLNYMLLFGDGLETCCAVGAPERPVRVVYVRVCKILLVWERDFLAEL